MLALARYCRRRSLIARYGLACAAVGLALALELSVAQTSGSRYLFIAFSPAVAFAAWYGGFGPGAFAVVLSLAATFLAGPATALRADIVALSTFAGCWLMVSLLAESVYRRLHREGVWRMEAERIAGQADRLEHFTAAVGNARTTADAIEACVQEALFAMGADAAALLFIAEDTRSAEIARAVGYAPEIVARWARVYGRMRSPIADAARNRTPVIFESRKMRIEGYPAADDLYAADHEAGVAVPLGAGGRVIAVLRLDFARARSFETDDRQFLLAIAPRAAQALDRTAQYEAAQRARAEAERERMRADEELAERQRIEQALRASEVRYRALAARTGRLHDLSAALAEAVTLEAVARAVVEHTRIVVGATTASVALLVENGAEFETLCGDDTVPGQRFPRAPGLCATAAVDTREAVFVGSFAEWQERYPRSAALAADAGCESAVALPLLVEGDAIAVLEFHFTVRVKFDDEYRALLVSVAQHCAQALDRARLYERAQHARTEAEAANRLKDDFLSVVSHELRTPLNSILGWASILGKGQLEPARAQRALRAIQDNAARQARLVDELLDFSRIVAGRVALDLQPIDLTSLLNAVAESVLPAASAKGVDLSVDAPARVMVLGDVRRLEQVFFNLLGNAVKFTADRGTVRVQVRATQSDVTVSVTDTGMGIEPAFLPYVFDRFRQADATITRNYGGLGLGLSIAKQLVEAHKGAISAESGGVGHGSTFSVTLALASARAEPPGPRTLVEPAATAPAGPAVPAHLDGIQVLVVDDEADARDVTACALAACGAKVVVAARAVEALELLVHERVDVLLADIAMPDLDGYTFMRQVRRSAVERVAKVPAAAVTAHVREDEKRQALDAGFQVHVAKPIDPARLAHVVERLARSRAPNAEGSGAAI